MMNNKKYFLTVCVMTIGIIWLTPFFVKAGSVYLDLDDKQFVLQRLMIAKARQYMGDNSAGMLLKELRKEANENGVSLPAWAEKGASKKFNSCIQRFKKHKKNLKYTWYSRMDQYNELIIKASQAYGLSPALIKAVIKVESGFIEDAVSRTGAQGLMQIMPDTAKDLNIIDVFDPSINILGGTRLLRQNIDEFGSLKRALIAYNAGAERIRKGKSIPRETQKYIRNVIYYYHIYRNNNNW